MSVIDKKERENAAAKFFAYHKLDWCLYEITDKEYDCIFTLTNWETIQAQIVWADQDLIDILVEASKTKEKAWWLIDPIKNIVSSIDKKNKHYSSEVLENMILLVRITSGLINHEYLLEHTKKVCEESGFKNIYYIKLPYPLDTMGTLWINWDILKLK